MQVVIDKITTQELKYFFFPKLKYNVIMLLNLAMALMKHFQLIPKPKPPQPNS